MFTELYELTEVAHAVQEIIAEVRQNDEFNRLLIRQNDDGTWPSKQEFSNEQRQQSMQFFSQIMELHRLLDHGATRDVPEVQEGIVALMKMQHPDGKFPLFYQHQGYALWVLMRYGLQGNPFVDRGMRWLLRRQRNDGGWLHLVHVPAGEDKDTYPSCIWTTCHVLWPLVLHNVYYKDDRVRKGLDYLLDNFLQTNHTKFLNAPDAWDYLYVGYDESGCFRGGTLKVLEIVTNAGYDRSNTVVKKASNWLRDQQLDSGLFPAVAGKDTVGDFMVTLRALSVLKKLFSDSVIK
ncbi:MAG: hypothetical protein K9N46_09745 [Candidatus Marinimicrobia bacterium]|nr:hypothetical protein [Candidatus Neomarinimicrobiota bacterium]MCF7828398.1 hypothetical protein [Candidatus Neomarinimicrobiota bacterium]MCF7881008.1 hypothetical protein [Candidatus Neomarinimicrobiota bacterium]